MQVPGMPIGLRQSITLVRLVLIGLTRPLPCQTGRHWGSKMESLVCREKPLPDRSEKGSLLDSGEVVRTGDEEHTSSRGRTNLQDNLSTGRSEIMQY